jgi:hypothetical protein
MKLQPTATKVCHVKHWSSDTFDFYLVLSSSLITSCKVTIALSMQLLCHEVGACLDQQRANYSVQGALASMMHIWCVLFSADTQMDKFGPSSFLWASFWVGAISDSCESSLLLRFFPPCYLSLECTRNSLLWLGSPAVQAFHYAVQLHESDIALGNRKGLKLLLLCQPFELWGCSLDR